MDTIEQYTRELDLGYRLVSYFLCYFRRWFDEGIEKRARQIVALETPRIYWTGFGAGALVAAVVIFVIYSSRQSLGQGKKQISLPFLFPRPSLSLLSRDAPALC
jgi:hypothetical protein